jgi:hypothetical protein
VRGPDQNRLAPGAAVAELGRYVATVAGKMLGALVPLGPYAAFLGEAAVELLGGKDHEDERRQHIDRQLSDVDRIHEEFRQARRRVIRDLQSRVDVLEGRLPSSRLSSED